MRVDAIGYYKVIDLSDLAFVMGQYRIFRRIFISVLMGSYVTWQVCPIGWASMARNNYEIGMNLQTALESDP
jgi:hypothetical protein